MTHLSAQPSRSPLVRAQAAKLTALAPRHLVLALTTALIGALYLPATAATPHAKKRSVPNPKRSIKSRALRPKTAAKDKTPKKTNGVHPRTSDAIPLAPPSASALLAYFRKLPGLQANFIETKKMALLALPLKSTGTLAFCPPGLLARHIHTPSASVIVIDPARVRIFDGQKWEEIDLKTKPVVRRFVESFVVLLKGDEAALRRRYDVAYSLNRDAQAKISGWKLRLKPRSAPLNKVVAFLELRGRGARVQQMRMVEVDGDETLTAFSKIDPSHRFTASERARVFHLKVP